MGTDEDRHGPPRKRLLITAYHYDREFSMESRLAWHRAQQAVREFDVTVICARTDRLDVSGQATEPGRQGDPVKVVRLPLDGVERALMLVRPAYYAGYRRWLRRVFRASQRLHAARPFSLVHHVSFCGFREPGDGWRLGVPFVWGPIGGTHAFPSQFFGELDARSALRELARNWMNRWQLRRSRRVRQAWTSAAAVLAANRGIARDLQVAFGAAPPVQLETGVEGRVAGPRPRRRTDEPFKILWSGRLQAWKGLSLLLKALAALPADCDYRLRILGEGPSEGRWRRLAQKLNISGRIEWVGWPTYPGQLPHYGWADAFAFTSLRDTSGTGLLEALAAGVPIIGVNHQGAADIMTEGCAIRVPVSDPSTTIAGFRDAVMCLATDAGRRDDLRRGALLRARDFEWNKHWDFMRTIYQKVIEQATGSPSLSRNSERDAVHPAPVAVGAHC